MAMKFEYDENGAKFVFFGLAFYAMIIIPCTYVFWPRKPAKKENHAEDVSVFEPCMAKMKNLNKNEPKKKFNALLTKAALVLFWTILVFLAFKASQIKTEHKEYDPYVILKLERGATDKEIRKQYREMSKVMHPDRGGDEDEFKELSKAYKALTDEETKNNWELYGNPDGPGAINFGIALPKWIVEGKNSYIVLGLYVLVFMIIMPTVVGMWWYKSIKYTGDQLLMSTTKVYYHCLMKNPQTIMKRVIMILGSSFEYDKNSNPEIIERPSDNTEMPLLMKELSDLQEKLKEPPYSYIYSIKARTLIHAHLQRIDLPADTLAKDRNIVVKKAPFLINEMVNVVSQLVAISAQHGTSNQFHAPKLETLENIMKLSPMIVQALWDKTKKQTLLQLPHLQEVHLRHFVTKKRNISDIKQFVQMNEADRRSVVRHLTDEQYDDVMRVAASYPLINMDIKTEVFDDEDDQIITAGAIVTVVVKLTRQDLGVLLAKDEQKEDTEDINEEIEVDGDVEELGPIETKANSPNKKTNKNTKGKANKKKPVAKKQVSKSVSKTPEKDKSNENLDGSDLEKSSASNDEGNTSTNSNTNNKSRDDYFDKFQQIQKKKESLETKEKVSHRVYCPFFPEIKQEYWWLYASDKKKKQIITPPIQICTLKDFEEVELKFVAPKTPGTYTYSVTLRSDSYLEFDLMQQFKFEVQPAKQIEEHPQWNFTDEEDGIQDKESDNEYNTESESDNE